MSLFSLPEPDSRRLTRWYFGGIAGTIAQVLIYPIDVLKVGIETEQVMERITTYRYLKYLLATQGLRRIYSGLRFSMRQQFIHSTTRFGIYMKIKELMQFRELPFMIDLSLSAFSGVCGAILKNPMEIVNIRMMTDFKLSPPKRYNYKNLSHGLKLISMTDGYRALFAGVQLTVARSVAFNVSQICFYYKFKRYLLNEHRYTDTLGTHILVSAITAFIVTIVSQPVDVLKLRYMSKTDEFSGIRQVLAKQLQLGIRGFYRGTLLSFLRTEIQTITTFVLMEKMRLHYGLEPEVCTEGKVSIWCIEPDKSVGEILEEEVIEGVERIEDALKETEALERLLGRLAKLKGVFWKITSYVMGDVEEEMEEEESSDEMTYEYKQQEDKQQPVAGEEREELDDDDDDEGERNRNKAVYDFSI